MPTNSDFSNKILPAKYSNKYVEHVDDLSHKHVVARTEECGEKIIQCTPIQEFYENQSIFITGGTGFLGKILIEKLLRSCPGIATIFILIREKKNDKVSKRLQDLLQNSLFENSRSNMVNFEKKLHAIAGDCSLENLGLNDNDAELLKREVSVVFHLAATVRFDEKLKKAIAVNVQSTSTIIDLCKEMKNLKSFVHVSTAYANCFASDIEEKFYNFPITHKGLLSIGALSEKTIEEITPQLMKIWPNTYTFTKALAEDLIRVKCTNLPVAVFRPGIVTSPAYEPMPGWIDNYNGAIGMTVGITSGVVRAVVGDPKALANYVPADLTVNALITSAWNLTLQTNRVAGDMLIYNYTSVNHAPITWGTAAKYTVKYSYDYPLRNALWCAMILFTKHKFIYNFYILFLHLIPAYLIDFGMRALGQKPRLVKAYVRIHKMSSLISYFVSNSWQFRDDNVQNMWNQLDARDQQIFRFSMLDFDWEKYIVNYIKGIRVFLFKDDLKTLESSRKKYKRFLFIHNLMIASLVGFAFWLLWRLFSMLFYRFNDFNN